MTPEEISSQIEKQNEGIRSLIIVARTCLDSIKELRELHQADYKKHGKAFKKLTEAQVASEEELNILIHTVDRIVGRINDR
jgi:hypothetical protein